MELVMAILRTFSTNVRLALRLDGWLWLQRSGSLQRLRVQFQTYGFFEREVEQCSIAVAWTEEEALPELQRMFAEAHATIIGGAPAPSTREPELDPSLEN